MTKVILVRHGQTAWNHEKKYQGHSDVSLNEVGLRQAQLAAERLAKEKIAAVYSSDLLRAVQTAEIIAKQHNLQTLKVTEFREINFGLWEGLTYDEIMKDWPDILTSIYAGSGAVSMPGGESFCEVKQRAVAALEKLIASHDNETIAIVAHGGVLRVLLSHALGMELDRMWSIGQDSAAISIIEYFGNTALVSLVNDTCHIH